MFLVRKKEEKKPMSDWGWLKMIFGNKDSESICEPQTIALKRLEGKAQDIDSSKALKMYNSHKAKIKNQWVNPYQSINTGNGTAQLSVYNYQTVNYYECYALAQDPLFTRIFNILTDSVFAKGGKIEDLSDDEWDRLQQVGKKYNLENIIRECRRSSLVSGGCLLYLDFGEEMDLEEPLDLKKVDMNQFKGFRRIDPINCVAVEVNTVNPSEKDYMEPEKWYIVGLGVVHKSHFLKFEENVPELAMKPLCLYFGMPLTQLIKQDIANSNLVSQGVANIVNKARMTFLKSEDCNYWNSTSASNFKNRLEAMGIIQDNFSVFPLKQAEEVQQFTYNLTGMYDLVKLQFQIVGSKTGIPTTVLLGGSAEGLNATGEGDRINWYDTIRNAQYSVEKNYLIMWSIVNGVETGEYKEFTSFVWNPLEVASEKETAENLRTYTETAGKLLELGAEPETVLDWLKGKKEFGLNNVEIDTTTPNLEDYDDLENNPAKVENEKIDWITVKGNHIPIKEGESAKEAVSGFIEKKSDDKKQDKFKEKKEAIRERLKKEPKKEKPYVEGVDRDYLKSDIKGLEKSLEEARKDGNEEKVADLNAKLHKKQVERENYFRERIPVKYKEVFDKAVKSEPRITDIIKSVCKESGGKPNGLDFRLKSAESFMRKVEADAFDEGKDQREIADKIYDAVRYTDELSIENFKNGVDKALKELYNKGCKLIQLKNYYLQKGNPYRGINCKFEDENGQKFELQFNTPNNLVIKEERLHPVYEKHREMPNGVGKVDVAYEMSKIAEEFDEIPDVEEIKNYP